MGWPLSGRQPGNSIVSKMVHSLGLLKNDESHKQLRIYIVHARFGRQSDLQSVLLVQSYSSSSSSSSTERNLVPRVNHTMPSFKRILKAFYADKVYYHFKVYVYFKKTFVVVEKDLSSLPPLGDALKRAGVEAVRVTAGALAQDGSESPRLRYRDDERRSRSFAYLRKGYRGVALVSNGEVVGDIWYCGGPKRPGNRPIHPDLKVLATSCGNHDAYGFDLYLCPEKRGKNWANLLQRAAVNEMKNDGFTRALGYYDVKNLPALWVHRTLQWTEVQRVDVMRFYFFRHTHIRSVRGAKVSTIR